MPSIPRVASDAPVEKILAALEESGAVILEGLLDAETLLRMNREIDPYLEQIDPGRRLLNPAIEWFFGKKTRQLTGVAAKSRTFASEVLCHRTYLAVCDAILLPSCATYQLNVAQVLDRGPGARLMPWARIGDIGCAASPSNSNPGLDQDGQRPTTTSSSIGPSMSSRTASRCSASQGGAARPSASAQSASLYSL